MSLQRIKPASPCQISTPLTDYPHNYEITLAFSDKLYSHMEALHAIHQATDLLNEWLNKADEVEKTIYVVEYTKKKQPHVHIAICCIEPLTPDFRHGIKQGLVRKNPDTRVTFSNVACSQSYNDYLEKDIAKNDEWAPLYSHKKEYSK